MLLTLLETISVSFIFQTYQRRTAKLSYIVELNSIDDKEESFITHVLLDTNEMFYFGNFTKIN